MAVYPGAIPDIPASGWTHDQVAQEIEAIAGELGVDPSGTSATVGDRMALDRTLALRPRLRAGSWYGPNYFTQGTTTVGSGALRASPFAIATAATFDRIGCEVTTAAAGTTFRMGIYNDDGTGYPGTLILDAGTVATDTTGSKEVVISQALNPGVYWLAGVAQGGSPTMRFPTQQSYYMPVAAPSAGAIYYAGYFWNGLADGPLPNPFPGATSPSPAQAPIKITMRVV